MNTLIIPGSFNPITNAHIDMAFAEAIHTKHVIFIPAHDTYVARKKTLIPGFARCKLIEDSTPYGMEVSKIEIQSFFPKRTYDTIREIDLDFNSDFQFTNIYICLGMDNIKSLTSWYNWKPFVEEYKFVACIREGKTLEDTLKENGLEQYKERFIEVKIPENNISSSLVRNLCEQKEFIKVHKLVPYNVYEYLRRFYETLQRI